jgi:ABC-type sulfate transport system substrate-binding protein
MYALITDGSISKFINNPKALVIGDVQYPAKIFSLWTNAEREAIGIYEVTFDNTNKKDEQWYTNTNQSYAYDADAGTVTATYGSSTAKAHADANGTDADGVELDPVVVIPGLKTKLIKTLKQQVANELARTDWYITRNTEKSTAIPSAITTHRDLVRTRQATMETQITNASDTPALETLYAYVNTGTEENPVMERPLGELPTLES